MNIVTVCKKTYGGVEIHSAHYIPKPYSPSILPDLNAVVPV